MEVYDHVSFDLNQFRDGSPVSGSLNQYREGIVAKFPLSKGFHRVEDAGQDQVAFPETQCSAYCALAGFPGANRKYARKRGNFIETL